MALYARTHYGDPVQAAYSTAQALPPPVGILGSNAPGHGPFLSRIEFEMYILSPSGERIHNHTSNQAEIGAPSRALEEVCNWRSSYPLLENYYGQGQLDSEIILVESNLSLLSEYPPNGSTLSIGFNVNMAGLAGNERWSTKTEYYENNGQPVDMRAFYALNQIRKTFPWDTPNVFPGSGRSDVKLEIPLQSTWWVQLFTKMAKRKQETNHHPYLSQQEDEWSRRYLQEMSIMQELWVNRESDGASDSRVAIILWKFSQTRAGVAGTTTWRKLKPPPARIKVNSPIQSPAPPLQHSLVLDSALQTLAMPQAVSVNAERFLHKANLFAEDTEGIVTEPRSARDSASPALSLDYTTSFPSSTSTSFPPSVTHGYLSHEESQESACYSQESERSRNGSLDAQYSFAFPHESCYPYQEPGAYNEDLTYISGSQEIESQDQAYYSQQSFDSRPDYHAQSQYDSFNGELTHDTPYSAHNFTGGQIQLSFEPHDIVSNAQIASAPNMAHVPHPSDTQGQTNEEELHPTSQSFPVVESNPVAADQAHHTDFDFSTLESHFTPEEIAAFRAQDSEHHQHGELGELLRSHGEMHDFDHHPLDTTESVEQPLGSAATTRFHDAAFSPI